MKGYKAFDKNLKCRGFQYEIGETYEKSEKPMICVTGFHFCKSIGDCYMFYPMDNNTRICEVEAIGDIVSDGTKYCTNKIRIVREIEDEQRRGNTSSNNEGYMNVGQKNKGNSNTGDGNAGNRNAGDWNIGRWNTGNWNTGGWNTGDYNIGNANTGNWNAGNRNVGDRNIGYWNTGDWNLTSWSSGCFNTETQKITIFDRPTDWTMDDWRQSRAYKILANCPLVSVEKGKLNTEAVQKWWDSLPEDDRQTILNLPNFDAKKFERCTGIKVTLK